MSRIRKTYLLSEDFHDDFGVQEPDDEALLSGIDAGFDGADQDGDLSMLSLHTEDL